MTTDKPDQTTEDATAEIKEVVDDLARLSLEREPFYDLLVHKIADRAAEKVEAANTVSRNRTAVIITVGGALFVSALTALSSFAITKMQESLEKDLRIVEDAVKNEQRVLTESINNELRLARSELLTAAAEIARKEAEAVALTTVETVVPQEVGRAVEAETLIAKKNWQLVNLAFELTSLSEQMSTHDSFSAAQAEDAMALLRSFADDNQYRDIPQFPQLLEEIVDNFVAAELDDMVASLEPLYSDLMLSELGISQTMTIALGRNLVSFTELPSNLGDSRLRAEWESTAERYHRYGDALRALGFPEYPYLFDAVIACLENQPGSVIAAYLRRSNDFTPEEVDTAIGILGELVFEDWKFTKDLETELASRRTVACLGGFVEDEPAGILNTVFGDAAAAAETPN